MSGKRKLAVRHEIPHRKSAVSEGPKCAFDQTSLCNDRLAKFGVHAIRIIDYRAAIAAKKPIRERIDPIKRIGH
jgi:hypothetical protein